MGPGFPRALLIALGALLVPAPVQAARPLPNEFAAALAAPALVAPAQGATGLPNDITLLWSRVPGATSYHVQVSRYSYFSPPVVDAPLVGDTSYAVTLASNTRYYWRVSASGPEGDSPYSSARTFVITTVPPPAPALVFPLDGVQDALTNQVLTWNAVGTSTVYRLKLCTTPDLSCSSEYWLNGVTSYSCSGLAEFTTYYWNVRASNIAGIGPPSVIWSFRTGPLRPAPELVAPEQNAILYSGQVTFRWHPVSDALSYHLRVSKSWAHSQRDVDEAGLQDTSFTASLTEGVTRSWWVTANYDLGPGLGSEYRDFQVWTSVPSSPALRSPPDGASSLPPGPILTWDVVGGAASYRLHVSTLVSFATTLLDTVVQAPGLRFDAPDTTRCFWRVNATSPLGTSPWSPVWSFECHPPRTDADVGPSRAPADGAFVRAEGEVPPALGVRLASPNPVAGDLVLELALPRASAATLAVFDLAGRRVLARSIGYLGTGRHVLGLDEGRRLPNGAYVLRLTQEYESASVRFIVLH